MKKIFVALCMVAFLAACDDSSSASAGQNDEPAVESSSSSSGKVTEPAEVTSSSSSVDTISSSSLQGDKNSSSSGQNEASSSSLKSESSSSVGDSQSSSSEVVVNSSSSVSELSSSSLNGFDWSLPKEAYFNPDIDYGEMTDERDGLTYKTIKIDEQTWMAQNLNYADSSKTPSLLGKSWCFDNDPKNCDVGGRLYTWAAAIDSVSLAANKENPLECGYEKICGLSGRIQGICPNGWHLPDSTEWEILFAKVGGQSVAGMYLKSKVGWHNNGNGLDLYGFSALPTGCMLYTGNFYDDGLNAYFWSSSERKEKYAYESYLYYEDDKAGMWGDAKRFAKSVRCVKD